MSFESEKEMYEMLGRYGAGFEDFCSAMISCIRNLLDTQGLKNEAVQEILLAGMTAEPLLTKLHSLVNAVIARNEAEQKIYSRVFNQFTSLINERNIYVHSSWMGFSTNQNGLEEFHLIGSKLGANKSGAASKTSAPKKTDLESSIKNCRNACLQLAIIMRIIIGVRTLSECFEVEGKELNVKYEALNLIPIKRV